MIKRTVPLVAQTLGISPLALAIERRWRFPSLRAVIYHSVPQDCADRFEQQVRYYARHYCSVTLQDLELLLNEGKWSKPKPGLMPTFDDGLRTHAEVAAPILEKYGFCGWFFVPTDFIDTPPEQQRAFANEHDILFNEHLEGDRVAMTWDQARDLANVHVVGGHTASHVRLSKDLSEEDLKLEIPAAKQYLERQLAGPVDTFAWVGGEEWSYSQSAARAIRDAGFRFSFMTNSARIDRDTQPLQLERCRVEPHWPMSMIRWQLSGLGDMSYSAKRERVHRVTS
ncbi:MAG: polysaccharide deacetylase family protein [Aeoliella sp.]